MDSRYNTLEAVWESFEKWLLIISTGHDQYNHSNHSWSGSFDKAHKRHCLRGTSINAFDNFNFPPQDQQGLLINRSMHECTYKVMKKKTVSTYDRMFKQKPSLTYVEELDLRMKLFCTPSNKQDFVQESLIQTLETIPKNSTL